MNEPRGPADAFSRFFNELNTLHIRAGAPSTRDLARITRSVGGDMSHTTVHHALRGPRLPRWETTRPLVEVLGGNLDHFRELWTAARIQVQGGNPVLNGPVRDTAATPDPGPPPAQGHDRSNEPREQRPRVEPQRPPTAGTGKSEALVAQFAGWGTLFKQASVPPIIQLMRAAAENNLDPWRQFLQVADLNPAEAAPGILMLADFDAARTAEVVANLAKTNHARVAVLLDQVVTTRPELAAAIIDLLLTRYDIHPTALTGPVVRCATSPGHLPLAARVLAAAVGLKEPNHVASQLVDLVRGNSAHITVVAAVFRYLLSRPKTQAAGGVLLAWVSRTDLSIGTEIFLHLILTTDGDIRRSTNHRTMIGIVAEYYPRGCPVLILAALYGKTHTDRILTTAQTGTVLAELAKEDLPRAVGLVGAIVTRDSRNPATFMPVLASITDTSITAGILLHLSDSDLDAAARLLAIWHDTPYPQVAVPTGPVIASMAARDAKRVCGVICRIASFRPRTSSPGLLLSGLEKAERTELVNELSAYLNGEQWECVAPLLMQRKGVFWRP